MLESYLKREDVLEFIHKLEAYPKYLKLNVNEQSNYGRFIKDEMALYAFYDFLLKYKLLVDDEYLFDEYLEQIEKLFKKLDNYDDIVYGANKLLCGIVATLLDVQDINSFEDKEKMIKYIYHKYIDCGYFYYGFSTVFENDLKSGHFSESFFSHFIFETGELKRIFEKYNIIGVFDENFDKNRIVFTDDFIMGCYYSMTSPRSFFELLFGEKIYGSLTGDEAFLRQDYDLSICGLKKFMSNNLFSEEDKNFVLDVVLKEWNYLHSVPRRVNLLLVKRSLIQQSSSDKLQDLLNKNLDIYESVDSIFSSKYANILYDGELKIEDCEVLSLEDFYKKEDNLEIDIKEEDEVVDVLPKDLLNSYGAISICLIAGALLITFGVVLTIVFVLGGI